MAITTYDLSSTESAAVLRDQLGQFVADQALKALSGAGSTYNVTQNFLPGDAIPNGTDILLVDPSVTGPVNLPDGIPVVVFTGPAGLQVNIDETNEVTVKLSSGNDVVDASQSNGDVVIDLGSGADKFLGARDASNIVFTGADNANDDVIGGDRNDVVTLGGGNDIVDGGDGTDTVNVSGTSDSYALSINADGSFSLTGNGSTYTLTDVEMVQFSDGTVLVNASSENDASASELYDAILGRTPDSSGLGYWFDNVTDRASLLSASNAFLHSQEFTSKFGNVDTMSNADFLNVIYQNALNRAPDADGSSYWLEELANGASKAEVALLISESAEHAAKSAIDTIIT